MTYIKSFCQKYKHLFPLAIFLIFYLMVFGYVENRPIYHMHLLASRFDHLVFLHHLRSPVLRVGRKRPGSVLPVICELDDWHGTVPSDLSGMAERTHLTACCFSKG